MLQLRYIITFKDKDRDIDSIKDIEQINRDTITKTYNNDIIDEERAIMYISPYQLLFLITNYIKSKHTARNRDIFIAS